jgi:hypothetical protein
MCSAANQPDHGGPEPDFVPIATILDAARQHFARVAGSANYTLEARNLALDLQRRVAAELAWWNGLSDTALANELR